MSPSDDLIATRERLQAGKGSAREVLEQSIAAAHGEAARFAFLVHFDDQARVTAEAFDRMAAAGVPRPPLTGLAISIKALFDVAGVPTTAAAGALHDVLPALADAVVVERLRRAGAALIGQTNQSELAFSGVGINPHHGTPANAGTRKLDATARIPGGSTSGGAVSVAAGAAWAALGSDTGGSIRIPAALQGLVGFKNTQALTPLAGSVPLSATLDTACAITRSVRDAVLLHEVLASRVVALRRRPIEACRFAVPRTVMLDALEPAVATAFERALRTLRDHGARIVECDWPELTMPAALQANGGFAAAESWAVHGPLLRQRATRFDPRVALRIRRGEAITAAEYIALQRERAAWIATMRDRLAPFDAALSPTVPIVAPPLAPLIDNDELFFATNGRLLRNPSIVNFLDGCALSLPCHAPGEMPVGLMVWSAALEDDTVLDAASAIESTLTPTLS